ncbi:MAG: oligoendopeptidase F, partial [Candidatus Marinimicrobia bacterium]|nr:oligoendopeptidase F [Candidatus Neomarinimicrobiota bacterium]
MEKIMSIITILLTFFLINSNVVLQTRERSEIPVEYTWDLTDLYDTDEAWADVKNGLITQFDSILKFKGELSKSPYNLLSCLKLDSKIKKELGRLRSNAGMKFDQDTRNSKYLAMKQEISQLYTDYNSKSSFINPEILKMDIKKIDEFISKESRLKDYKFYLYDLQRSKKHLLSEKEEKIIAETGLMAGTPYSIFSIFSNAEL